MIERIVRHKALIMIIFGVLTLISVLLVPMVKVNYDLLDYLPEDSESTIALHKMESAFDKISQNGTRVMVPVDGIAEALAYKERIAVVQGVNNVRWLDDAADIHQPLSFIDEDLLESYYKDGYALFAVQLEDDVTGKQNAATLDDIRVVIGSEGAMSGSAVNGVAAKQSSGAELKTMMLILLPLVLIILLLTTSSWFEPVLFIFVIGIAVIVNMGTNAFLGEISFVTQTASAVLQLAVSMDYSIFLLHRFRDYREEGLAPEAAMKAAMKSAFPTIVASGLTTVFGFAALTLMRFLIGVDMGVVLAKGVVFSLLSVVFLLPALAMLTYKVIEKTRHKSFIPKFSKMGKWVVKLGVPVIIIAMLVAVPCYLAQQKNEFVYGSDAVSGDKDSQLGQDAEAISTVFGEANQMILMVPEGDYETEKLLTKEVDELPYVTEVSSYLTTVGAPTPQEFVPEDTLSMFISNGYSRMIINVNASNESSEAFSTVESIRGIAHRYYDEYYLTGGSVNVYDMKQVVTADNPVVNTAAMIAIGLVILLTFRSISLPILLLLVIEISIWINLAVPYFSGTPLMYIGYIIISSIQLGATVDYAILYSSRYIEKRRLLGHKQAAAEAVSETFGSILTSATILICAGLIISMISTNGVIGQLGELIGRGAALSLGMVVLLLPALMRLCDPLIRKTTLKLNFKEDSIHEK